MRRKKQLKNNRPNSMSTCLAVARGKIDSFTKKNIFFCKLRKSTQTRAQFYADQMGVSIEQLFEALVENFVWVTIENDEMKFAINAFDTNSGKVKRLKVQKYNEEMMVNNLERYFCD